MGEGLRCPNARAHLPAGQGSDGDFKDVVPTEGARQGKQWFPAGRVMSEMLAFSRRVETSLSGKPPASA